jgi:hypothetical protein
MESRRPKGMSELKQRPRVRLAEPEAAPARRTGEIAATYRRDRDREREVRRA